MAALTNPVDEAREHLRVIRQTMERSTQYSTLSGWSGILIGLVALLGVYISKHILAAITPTDQTINGSYFMLLGLWLIALVIAVGIEFVCNKRRATSVGKRVVSKLGAHIMLAALPGFFAAAVLTAFLLVHQEMFLYVWSVWMLCYGIAICAVGIFSVRQVTMLGFAFVLAGAISLFVPVDYRLHMMAISFGAFHIIYGIITARRYGW